MSLVSSHRILIVTILLQIGSSWQRQRVFPDDLDVHDPVPDLRVPGAGQALRPLPVIVEQPRPGYHDRCRACDWSRVTIKASDWPVRSVRNTPGHRLMQCIVKICKIIQRDSMRLSRTVQMVSNSKIEISTSK